MDEDSNEAFLDDTELQDALEEPETKATLTGFFVNKGELDKSAKPKTIRQLTPLKEKRSKSSKLGASDKVVKKKKLDIVKKKKIKETVEKVPQSTGKGDKTEVKKVKKRLKVVAAFVTHYICNRYLLSSVFPCSL